METYEIAKEGGGTLNGGETLIGGYIESASQANKFYSKNLT